MNLSRPATAEEINLQLQADKKRGVGMSDLELRALVEAVFRWINERAVAGDSCSASALSAAGNAQRAAQASYQAGDAEKKAAEYAAAAQAAAVSLASAVEAAQAAARDAQAHAFRAEVFADAAEASAAYVGETGHRCAARESRANASAAAAKASADAADKAATVATAAAGAATRVAAAADKAAECKAANADPAPAKPTPRRVTWEHAERPVRYDENGTPFFVLETGFQHGHVWQSEDAGEDDAGGNYRIWRCRYCGRVVVVIGERAKTLGLRAPGTHEFHDDPTAATPVAPVAADHGTR